MSKTKAEILDYIKEFADKAHGTQVRKYTGERYIAHPVRVMETVRKYNDQLAVLGAALLHDVLEDTPVTEEDMAAALGVVMDGPSVAVCEKLVVELTDIYIREDFPRLNRRTRKEKEARRLATVSAEAQTIKYADIIDNVTDIVMRDPDFARTFVREAKIILMAMDAGHPELRKKALATVDRCLVVLRAEAEFL